MNRYHHLFYEGSYLCSACHCEQLFTVTVAESTRDAAENAKETIESHF